MKHRLLNMESRKRDSTWWPRYLSIAKQVSTWSKDPSTQVGAISVGSKGQILAQGYNGYLSGCPHDPIMKDGHNIGTIHAEQNAIVDCAKRGVSSNLCTAFITHYPCFNCFKLLVASGINEIKYCNDYKNDPEVKNLSEKIHLLCYCQKRHLDFSRD